jgi:hypothetical protein
MNIHIKRYVGPLYYSHGVRGGNAWYVMWTLGQTLCKKLMPITRLSKTLIVCTGMGK